MGLLNNLSHLSLIYIPFVIVSLAVVGSWHCSLMCGSLVLISCKTKVDHIKYQLGRLLGYLLLIFLTHKIGNIFLHHHIHQIAKISSLLLGLSFIIIGFSSFKTAGKIKIPFLSSLYKMSFLKKALKFPFLTGLISFSLPCGFLYTVVMATLILSLPLSLYIIFFFWLGTSPALIISNKIIMNIMQPIKNKSPNLISLFFIILGIITILIRLNHHHS